MFRSSEFTYIQNAQIFITYISLKKKKNLREIITVFENNINYINRLGLGSIMNSLKIA